MNIGIKHIRYHLPETIVSNDDLQNRHSDWDIKKIAEKSGIYNRHIASKNETAYDLAVVAVAKILEQDINKNDIDGIIFCTQSPDYIMPSNAFLIHKKFDFKTSVWSFDYNLACSGYIYGISIARGMIMSGMAKNVMLINADTYSKYINENDKATSVLFGDGAAVSIISEMENSAIIDITLATAGSEYESFYIPAGGCRLPQGYKTKELVTDYSGNQKTLENIHMNGFAVWKFISKIVPQQIIDILGKNKISISDINFFGFHQASKLTLDSLIKALKIDPQKSFNNLDRIGNTVSASIPILLKDAIEAKKLMRGDLILISGFGVGLSWGTIILKF
ncbi:MAG: ketoacyl-ACP synthase III [Bacteroidota bacterium]